MTIIPQVTQPSDNKPVYLIVVNDHSEDGVIVYYETKTLTQSNASIEFRGFKITKEEADKLSKETYAKSENAEPVNRIIPWHNIIRIENTTYKKSQGEKNE